MAKRKTPTAFEVHIDAPATPDFVAKTAQLVSSMLAAAGQVSTDPGITLEVFNYHTKLVVHPRSVGGRKAADQIVRFVSDPVGTARKSPQAARQIASVLTEQTRLLRDRNAEIVMPRGKTEKRALLDKPFLDTVRGLSEADAEADLHVASETEEISQILRVGRSSPESDMTARIHVNCEPYDLKFAAQCKDDLFALAASEKLARLRLEVVADPAHRGRILPKASRIVAVSSFEEMSGVEFIQFMQKLAEPGPIFSRSEEDILADLEESW